MSERVRRGRPRRMFEDILKKAGIRSGHNRSVHEDSYGYEESKKGFFSNYQERLRMEQLRDNSNPFKMAEEKFEEIFRLPRSGAFQLIEDLDDQRLDEGFIPKHIKVLSALQFFAQGSYQTAVGQENVIALSQSSVSRCIALTADVIVAKLSHSIIKFPMTERERLAAMTDFQEIFNIPNTIGAVDGTHIAISKPPTNHPTAPGNLFYNRKGFYSINCQIVCSAKGKIIGLNPNFPGSTHDAAIWRASDINQFLKNMFLGGIKNQWLLGDKGYPLQPWLMTPLMEATTEAELTYNACHARARDVVKMCNGRLKNKFRCLHRHRCLHYKPERAAKIILACCTLYNMFLDAFNDGNDYEEDNEINVVEEEDQDFLTEAKQIQAELIQSYLK